MSRDNSIIPKIIVILGFLSVVGIILLFFRPRPSHESRLKRPATPEKLFAQVILSAQPKLLQLWEEGDRLIKKQGLSCPEEISFDKRVGRSYYQCQPHFWQCYWSGGVNADPSIKLDLFGQSFHVRAKRSFKAIPEYSASDRFYEILHGPYDGMNFHYGVLIELSVDEIQDMTWPVVMTDTCRDVYLPQRLFGYGKVDPKKGGEGFIWDNFQRDIFIDKFYVTQQQVNEWRHLTNEPSKIVKDRKLWPLPAILGLEEQKKFCNFWGKRPLEAHLFDAATFTPIDQKETMPEKVSRPQTPWQRDLSKSFLGMARINDDYQLTPLDCQLAQVQGCHERYFTTDSVTWMGMNYALGFFPEALVNPIEPEKNLKASSRFYPPQSEVHELGRLEHWDGQQNPQMPVAFRCYEEVVQ